jgi:hypothetical protein
MAALFQLEVALSCEEYPTTTFAYRRLQSCSDAGKLTNYQAFRLQVVFAKQASQLMKVEKRIVKHKEREQSLRNDMKSLRKQVVDFDIAERRFACCQRELLAKRPV